MTQQFDLPELNQSNSNDPHKTTMMITYGLFIAGLIFGGIPTLIGIVLAYVKRNETQGTLYYSHYRYLIRSFWIGVLGFLVSIVLSVIGIGILIMGLVGVWYLVRVIYGFIKVLDKKTVNPESWLL